MAYQYVRLVNRDKIPFDFHMNNQKRRIAPDGDMIVPWDIASTLFGDPRTLDEGRAKHRTLALKRARGNFNYELGIETDEAFEARRPKIEVYDTENNQRIFMLIEDPDGLIAGPSILETTQDSEVEMLRRQVARMESRMAQLLEKMTSNPAPMATGQLVIPSRDAGPGVLEQLENMIVNDDTYDEDDEPLRDAAGNPIVPTAFAPEVIVPFKGGEDDDDNDTPDDPPLLPAATEDAPTITPVAPADPAPAGKGRRLPSRPG